MEISNKLKILIAEDNPVDLKLLEGMLRDIVSTIETFDVVESVETVLALISEKSYDLLILDLNLLDSGGIETVKDIVTTMPDLPIVVNTSEDDESSGIRAVKAGAEDFLVKGKYTPYILQKTLFHAIERKRIEVELKNAYRKLQETQEQLIEAEKMKLIGGLAAGIAHEVKNPLSTITYAVTYLKEHVKTDNENYDEVIENIKESTMRADSIIMDLLDFAKIDNVQKKNVSINQVIDRVTKLISFQFDKHSININKEYENNIAPINIDEKRIHQVILNVLLNAEHSILKNGTVTIKTFSGNTKDLADTLDASGSLNFPSQCPLIVVQIMDDGCGIPEDKLHQLCDPFYTTRRAKGGVGLGLSVVKTIMDRHGAQIMFQNNQTKGVTVTLIFKQGENS